MATNEFLPLGTGGGANVQSQAAYAAEPLRPVGNQPGVAVSAFNNKALRQSTYIAAALAQFLCNTTGDDVLDDTLQANLLATMAKLWSKAPTITKLTAGAGTYTPPAAARWLKIKGIAGGAGGSGTALDGAAGGDTTFGTAGALVTAKGGGTVTKNIGGIVTIGAPAVGFGVKGADAGPAMVAGWGGKGAGSPFADGPAGGNAGAIPIFPPANTGVGGSGGAAGTTALQGFGGGAGGYFEVIIPATLAANYAYTVGAAGASGFTCANGTDGSSGFIEIEEHYGS